MADEMKKLRKRVRRKRIRKIIIGLLITVVSAIVIIVLINIFFVVKNIEIKNETSYDALEVLEYAGVKDGTSIFSVNGDKIYEKIVEKYPYVSSVKTEISLPNSINVSLATTTAKICAKTKSGKFIALDKSLKVLEESVSQIPDTIFADGLEIEKYKIGKVLDENSSPDTLLLSEILTSIDLYFSDISVKNVDMTNKYSIIVNLDNITIELGNSEELDRKMKMARKVYDDNDASVKAIINVRDYTKGRYRTLENQ